MAKERPIVWIDMDGTLFDFDTPVLARAVPAEQHVARQHFYVYEDYPHIEQSQFSAVYNQSDFFDNLEVMDGAYEAWAAMRDNGYDPRILSAPLAGNPRAVEGKKASLEHTFAKEFGQAVVQNAVFDKEKWRYPGLALIDDRPTVGVNPQTKTAPWEHVLFGWSHFTENVPMATAAFRLLSWRDPGEVVLVLDTIQDLEANNRV